MWMDVCPRNYNQFGLIFSYFYRLCKSTWGHCSIYNKNPPLGFSFRKLYMQLDEGSLTFNANPEEVSREQGYLLQVNFMILLQPSNIIYKLAGKIKSNWTCLSSLWKAKFLVTVTWHNQFYLPDHILICLPANSVW